MQFEQLISKLNQGLCSHCRSLLYTVPTSLIVCSVNIVEPELHPYEMSGKKAVVLHTLGLDKHVFYRQESELHT